MTSHSHTTPVATFLRTSGWTYTLKVDYEKHSQKLFMVILFTIQAAEIYIF